MKLLLVAVYYQLLIFLRIKQAVFFSLAFPIFLFVIFGSIWGGTNPDYIPFLLSGVLGMTIASEGLFVVGPVIKEYYANGLIKYFKKLPFNVLWHFIALITSRVIVFFVTLLLLVVVAKIVFACSVGVYQILHFALGALIGLFVFSFIGLCLAFFGIKYESTKGMTNFIYFILLFTSTAFYSIGSFNTLINTIGNILPLNPVLAILRNENPNVWIILLWTVLPISIFYYLFTKTEFKR